MSKQMRYLWWIGLYWGWACSVAAQPEKQLAARGLSVTQMAHDFEAAPYEQNCMRWFDDTASGVHSVNVFLLAKMTEMMYAERLDYQLRYLNNNREAIDTFQSSDWIKEHCLLDADNFGYAFEHRFRHFFGKIANSYETPDGVEFRFLHRTHTQTARFLGFKYKSGLDPELIIVSTPQTVFILFRGTDDVGEHDWAEWLGTDFRWHQKPAGGTLSGTRIHTGFWLSFDLIRDDLIAALTELNAKDKTIWLAGHSLGAAQAVIAGTYLKAGGWNVQNIYAYACPRTIGNRAFNKKANELLPNRIQRFEYYRDPVTMAWMPGLKYDHIGQRNWYDEEKLGNYQLYTNTLERRFFPLSLRRCKHIEVDLKDRASRKRARRIKRCQHSGTIFVTLPMGQYHNPQWYVKAAYAQLTEEQKAQLPQIDDSYPYFYYGRKDAR